MGGTQRTGSANLFDGADYTEPSEYSSRQDEKIDTLQIHHATMTSLSGLIELMQPGGRQVSANGAMSNTGFLVEVVPLQFRAFTSASSYDRRCLTVECCNTSLAPNWGISEATHRRLAQLAADMFRVGILGSLTRKHIIGHYEVPGTYATACPGPSMNLDFIVTLANELYYGANRPKEETEMSMERHIRPSDGVLMFNDEMGVDELRDYATEDMSNAEVVDASNRAWGAYTDPFDGNERLFEVAQALGRRRWEAKKAEIVDAIIAKLDERDRARENGQ